MKVFNYIYYWVSNSRGFKDLANGLYKEFFTKDGGFLTGFIIAAVIALGVAALYYLICHKSYKPAKLIVWLLIFFLVGGSTYYVTGKYSQNMMKVKIEKKYKEMKKGCEEYSSEEEQATCNAEADEFYDTWKKENKKPLFKQKLINKFALMNLMYSMIFFFVFSLLFKNYSCFGKTVPFGFARINRKK